MMNLRTFIWVACVINLGLILMIVRQGKPAAPPAPPPERNAPANSQSPGTNITTNSITAAFSATGANNWPPFRWEQIESDNYLELIQNLRDVGCPESTIRDLVIARVQDDYAETAWQAQKPMQAAFWEMAGKLDDFSDLEIPPPIEEQLEAIQKEKRQTLAEVQKAFAPDRTPYFLNTDRWSFLSPDLREQVRNIHEQIEDKRRELRQELRDANDPEVEKGLQQALQGLNGKRTEAIKAVIGEDNWARYDATRGQIAQWIRALPGVSATPEEMQQIVRQHKALESEKPRLYPDSTDEERENHGFALEKYTQRKAGIVAQVLGEERNAHIQRAEDAAYLTMRKVCRRHGLPLDIANRAYEVKQSAQAQLDALLARQLDDERRLQATAALLLTVKSELAGIYGEQAWPSYEKYGMDWFNKLTQSAEKVEESETPP